MPAIIVKGDYQAQAIRFLPPNTTNLLYWGMYGKNVSFTSKNHKDGSVITAIGTPVYPDNNYAVFQGGANYLKTAAVQTPDMTFFSVFKIDNEGSPAIVSNYASPGQVGSPATVRGAGIDLFLRTPGSGKLDLTMNASVNMSGTDALASVSIVGGYTLGTWCAVAGTVNNTTGLRKIYSLTTGTSAVVTNTNQTSLGSAGFQIGSNITTPNATLENIAMAAIYSDAKTDADIQAIYTKMKAYFAKRGIAI